MPSRIYFGTKKMCSSSGTASSRRRDASLVWPLAVTAHWATSGVCSTDSTDHTHEALGPAVSSGQIPIFARPSPDVASFALQVDVEMSGPCVTARAHSWTVILGSSASRRESTSRQLHPGGDGGGTGGGSCGGGGDGGGDGLSGQSMSMAFMSSYSCATSIWAEKASWLPCPQ